MDLRIETDLAEGRERIEVRNGFWESVSKYNWVKVID
jgi:hypothetical protein